MWPDASQAQLKQVAASAGARLAAIRREGRPKGPWRSIYAVTCLPGSEAIRECRVNIDDPRVITDPFGEIDGSWSVGSEAMWAVCTQGAHDPCCAVLGRPLLAAFTEREIDIWQINHLGGDRFAANIIMFPEGHFFGRVSPRNLQEILEAADRKRVYIPLWRGRCSAPHLVQAAQHQAAQQFGADGYRDFPVWSIQETCGHQAMVRIKDQNLALDLPFQVTWSLPAPKRLTCHATKVDSEKVYAAHLMK